MYRTEYRTFTIDLTPMEIYTKDAAVRAKVLDARKLLDDASSAASKVRDLKEQAKGVRAEAETIAVVAKAGKENRQIKCEWRPDANAPRMNLHRLDVADDAPQKMRIVDSRPMTEAEKKGEFSGEVAPSSKVGASDSAAANGHANGAANGTPKKKGRPAKEPEPCPATLAEPVEDDPRQDTLCPNKCVKGKVACDEHLDGMKGSDKVHWIARKSRREYLVAEAEKAAQANQPTEGTGEPIEQAAAH